MELSIIIVNHNTREMTEKTVASILSTVKETDYEIVLVDNSTKADGMVSVEDPHMHQIGNVVNKGFGNACNIGAQQAKGDFLLFLNSDTVLRPGTVDGSLAYLKTQENAGILGVRMLLPDGKLDHGCKRGFPTPMASFYYFAGLDKRYPESKKYGAYRQTFVPERSVTDVDSVSGAYMLMPRTVFLQMNGFDEDYFMYGEDVDLCYRVKQAGYRVIYYGKVFFIHIKGQSGMAKSSNVLNHFYDAMRIFYKKHYQKKYNFFTNHLVYWAIDIKCRLALRKARKAAPHG